MSKSIFELSDEARALDALIDEHLAASGGVLTPEIEATMDDWLGENEAGIGEKLDAYVAVIATRTVFQTARKEEAKRITALAKSDENTVKSLKERLVWFFQSRGIEKHETMQHKFSLGNAGGVQGLEIEPDIDLSQIDQRFVKIETVIDTDAVKAALAAGEELPFAALKPRAQRITIR